MRHPDEIVAEANATLDDMGEVLAGAAPPIAPDFAARTAIVVRDGLLRHAAKVGDRYAWSWFCDCDGDPWPCPDVRGYLSLLGVPINEED